MGWKNVKEHYRISHIVSVRDDIIRIGSAYISNIIEISFDGEALKRYDKEGVNENLIRYQKEFDDDPAMLKKLIKQTDAFIKSITVYTYDGAEILEKQCEELGWPNVTHDGEIMYENTHSANREEVVKWAHRDAEANLKHADRRIKSIKQELIEARKWAQEATNTLVKLKKKEGLDCVLTV